MNRGEITTRCLKILERSDSEADTLVDDWVRETIKKIEDTYPLPYTKKIQSAALTADEGTYTLPTDLILHHPYMFRMENPTDATKFTPVIKIGEETYNLLWLDSDATASRPEFWYLKGGTNGLEFEVVNTPAIAQNIHLTGGYFYTDLSTWNDTDDAGGAASNWLTATRQDLVIAGVVAKGFMFYEENEKADRWWGVYQLELNGDRMKGIPGLIGDVKREVWNGRRLRSKFAYDEPYAIQKRRYGY